MGVWELVLGKEYYRGGGRTCLLSYAPRVTGICTRGFVDLILSGCYIDAGSHLTVKPVCYLVGVLSPAGYYDISLAST